MEKNGKQIITENELKGLVGEMMNEIITEAAEPLKKGTKFKAGGNNPKILAKVIAKQYGVNPNDFDFDGINLVYNPRKKIKQRISKPEGMSAEQYYKEYVLPNNPKMQQQEQAYPDEQWKPVQNIGRYFKGLADFSSLYEVSNYGRLRVINFDDAEKSNIYSGYEAPTRNAMQFHLNTVSTNGDSLKTCPDVKYIVADAWLEPHDPKKYMVVQKDGDWRNNKVDNLVWIPRKKSQRM